MAARRSHPVGAIAGFGLAFALGLLPAPLSYQRQVFGILHHSLGVAQLGPNKSFVGIDGMEHRDAAIGFSASALGQASPFPEISNFCANGPGRLFSKTWVVL